MSISRERRGLSWDFSTIPVSPPERASQAQPSLSSRTAGFAGVIQAKLQVGAVDDPLEHEADRVAEQVMHMPDAAAVAPPVAMGNGMAGMQRKPTGPQVSRLGLSHASSGMAAPPSVHEVLNSPGQPLDSATRAFMEPRFSNDFSGVRVHTDPVAEQSARDTYARAYTVGNHMAFGAGQYAPETQAGRGLIAHELSHVVQQKGAGNLEKLQREPEEGSKDPPIAGTTDDPTGMWKDVVADRHFQQAEGNVTFARLKILDREGRTVVNLLTQSDPNEHAEEKAVRLARAQIRAALETPGEKIDPSGGNIVFVTDQTVCAGPGRCHAAISRLAEELGVEDATVTTFMRPALKGEPKGTVSGTGLPQQEEHALAGPKATAKKVQQAVVGGLELTSATEVIYTRGRASGGGVGGSAPSQKTAGQAAPPGQTSDGTPVPKQSFASRVVGALAGQGAGDPATNAVLDSAVQALLINPQNRALFAQKVLAAGPDIETRLKIFEPVTMMYQLQGEVAYANVTMLLEHVKWHDTNVQQLSNVSLENVAVTTGYRQGTELVQPGLLAALGQHAAGYSALRMSYSKALPLHPAVVKFALDRLNARLSEAQDQLGKQPTSGDISPKQKEYRVFQECREKLLRGEETSLYSFSSICSALFDISSPKK